MAFKGIDFVPHGTKIPFVSMRNIAFILSGIAMIASIALFSTKGLNYGIDFIGGTSIEVRHKAGPADIADVREKVGALGFGDVQIQQFNDPRDVLVRIESQAGDEEANQKALDKIKVTLGDAYEFRNTEVIGPTVSGELTQAGIIAVITAIIVVLIYIWLRFEWQFSLGAVVALVHDIVLTIGIFSLLQLEFTLSIIAALLTIVGYSLNDTVVVYDRVRENLRKYKKMPLNELLDVSINETLSRTILTSVTTLIALVSLFVFGGEVIRGFVFAMIWGVLVGTYSSIFIASPVLLLVGVKRDWSGLGGAKFKEPGTAK
jgi:preprotein translocase SecF subunit